MNWRPRGGSPRHQRERHLLRVTRANRHPRLVDVVHSPRFGGVFVALRRSPGQGRSAMRTRRVASSRRHGESLGALQRRHAITSVPVLTRNEVRARRKPSPSIPLPAEGGRILGGGWINAGWCFDGVSRRISLDATASTIGCDRRSLRAGLRSWQRRARRLRIAASIGACENCADNVDRTASC